MSKQIIKVFNKKMYLLGTTKADNKKCWLVAPSWDCGWYWGFGYIQTLTNETNPERSRDIESHTHFGYNILNGGDNGFNNFKEYFSNTPLSDDEIWTLCDYMKTFYTLQKTAELFGRGYSYYTERAKIDELKDTEQVDKINKTLLPILFDKIDKLLTPQEN